jgi:ABC-type multidrug transport system permease subunit
MILRNHPSFWRNIALGVLLASTFTLLACGASHNMPGSTMPGGTMPGGTMPGGTMPGGTMPGQSPHPMSHPRPHP